MALDQLEQAEIAVIKKTTSTDLRKTNIKNLMKAKTKSFDCFMKQILAYFKFSNVLNPCKNHLSNFFCSFSKCIVALYIWRKVIKDCSTV